MITYFCFNSETQKPTFCDLPIFPFSIERLDEFPPNGVNEYDIYFKIYENNLDIAIINQVNIFLSQTVLTNNINLTIIYDKINSKNFIVDLERYNILIKNINKFDYQKNKATWTETIRGLKEQELQDLQDKINQFQSDSQDKFASKKQELYAPILKKADDAVKAVAKENGYSYVFDTSAGAVLYAWDSDDLMALVKKKLGLQ